MQGTVALDDAVHMHPRTAFHQHLDRAVWQLEQLQHLGQGADRVQVTGIGIVGLGRLLRQQQDLLVGLHRLLQRAHGLVPTDEQRDDHVREHHHVAQGQHGQLQDVGSGAGHGGSGQSVGSTVGAVLAQLWGLAGMLARSPGKPFSDQADATSPGVARGLWVQQPQGRPGDLDLTRPRRPWARRPASGRSGTDRSCARSPTRPPPPCSRSPARAARTWCPAAPTRRWCAGHGHRSCA